MIRTNNVSEIHGVANNREGTIDPKFLAQFARVHEENGFARILIRCHTTAPDGWALAQIRQIIESVFRRLLHDVRLEHERPHTLGCFLSRLAARIGLRHTCIWLNRDAGHPDLAIAGFINW